MKLLTAAAGDRLTDFTWTVPGELVRVATPCARDAELKPPPGDDCGCGRAFVGLSTARATTLAVVTDLDLTPADLAAAVRGSLESAGWADALTRRQVDRAVKSITRGLLADAHPYPTGTLVERTHEGVRAR